MSQVEITISHPGYCCQRCGHQWVARPNRQEHEEGRPRMCPKCKSVLFDVPKKK